jgi:hypothetical protein
MTTRLPFYLVATATLASAACTIDIQGEGNHQVVVREQKRLALSGDTPDVTIRSFDGAIELRPGAEGEVIVDIEKRGGSPRDLRDVEVEARESGGSVFIEAKRPRRSRQFIDLDGWTSPSVRLTVTVPRRVNVEARTADGAIYASGITGRVELRTGDGSVRLQRVSGIINVGTGDGAVSARELEGDVIVNTGDGSVEVSGRFEELRARTGDGAIGIDALPGSIMRRSWTVASGDGSVMIRLPADFNADLEATTGDGSIVTSGIELTRPSDPEQRRHDIRGRIGAGGEMLTVRTGDGSINLIARTNVSESAPSRTPSDPRR